MGKAKNRTVNLLLNIFIFYGIIYTIIDPLIPLISEKLKIGYDKIGLILLFASVMSLFATFISGKLSDRYNIKRVILIGLIAVLGGFVLYSIYLNLIFFVLTVVLFRVGWGILDASVHTYASQLFYKDHSPLFLKLDFFWYVGAIIGPIVISAMLFLKLDTKYAFIFFAVSFLMMIIFFWKLCPRLYVRKTTEAESFQYRQDSSKKENNTFYISKNPIILLACISMFLYIGILSGLSAWLTTYFTFLNIPVSFGSVLLSFFWIFSALGVFLAGKLIKRSNEISLVIIGSILGAASISLYTFLPIVYLKIVFLMLIAFCYASFFPLLTALAVHENPDASGSILGIIISAAIAGTIIFQPLIGYMAQYFGKDTINYVIFIAALIEIPVVAVLFRLLNKKYNTRISFSYK
ncbi:MAG: MFS transporter [Actinobacteria bacterium]|nr:MFS transporter [Actinomycetota bacterium]